MTNSRQHMNFDNISKIITKNVDQVIHYAISRACNDELSITNRKLSNVECKVRNIEHKVYLSSTNINDRIAGMISSNIGSLYSQVIWRF